MHMHTYRNGGAKVIILCFNQIGDAVWAWRIRAGVAARSAAVFPRQSGHNAHMVDRRDRDRTSIHRRVPDGTVAHRAIMARRRTPAVDFG